MSGLELSILSLTAYLSTPSHLSVCLCLSLCKDLLSPLQYNSLYPLRLFSLSLPFSPLCGSKIQTSMYKQQPVTVLVVVSSVQDLSGLNLNVGTCSSIVLSIRFREMGGSHIFFTFWVRKCRWLNEKQNGRLQWLSREFIYFLYSQLRNEAEPFTHGPLSGFFEASAL